MCLINASRGCLDDPRRGVDSWAGLGCHGTTLHANAPVDVRERIGDPTQPGWIRSYSRRRVYRSDSTSGESAFSEEGSSRTVIGAALRAHAAGTLRHGRGVRLLELWTRPGLLTTMTSYCATPGETGKSSGASGMSMTKTQPLSGKFRIWMSPPCALTAFRAIESPKPRPVRSPPLRSPND